MSNAALPAMRPDHAGEDVQELRVLPRQGTTKNGTPRARPQRRAKKAKPDLEGMLVEQIAARALPAPVLQSRLPWKHTKRLFRGDLLWPEQRLLVEVDGGVYTGGRHATGQGIERDNVKHNLAVLNNYRVLRVNGSHVRDGSAVAWIAAALGVEETTVGFAPPSRKKTR